MREQHVATSRQLDDVDSAEGGPLFERVEKRRAIDREVFLPSTPPNGWPRTPAIQHVLQMTCSRRYFTIVSPTTADVPVHRIESGISDG